MKRFRSRAITVGWCTCLMAVAMGFASVGCKRRSPTDAIDGHELFEGSCARCHGSSGQGGPPQYRGGPAPRNFHDHAFHASRSDAELRETIVRGKGVAMPGFGSKFSDAELTALVGYLRGLDPEPAARTSALPSSSASSSPAPSSAIAPVTTPLGSASTAVTH